MVGIERAGRTGHPPQQLSGQRRRDGGAVRGHLAGDGDRGLEHLVFRDHLLDQPAFMGFGDGHHLRADRPLQSGRQPDEPRQEPARRGFGHQAAGGEDEAEFRVLRGDPDVGGQCHRDPDAGRRTVHRHHDRLQRGEHPQRELAALVGWNLVRLDSRRGVERRSARLEIGAGAERAAVAGQHDGANGVVGVGLVERGPQFLPHLHGEGVEPVGSIEPEDRDLPISLDGDGGLVLSGLAPDL